jgi:hypothetical protein
LYHEAASRLQTLFNDFPAGGNDLTLSMTYNSAGQIVTRGGAHGVYAFTGHGSGTTSSPRTASTGSSATAGWL